MDIRHGSIGPDMGRAQYGSVGIRRDRYGTEEALARVDPLLRQLATRLATPQAPRDDLWQEARLALVRVMPRFDPACAQLTKFAVKHGRAAMTRYLRDRTALIRKPAWRWERGGSGDGCKASLGRSRREERGYDPREEIDSAICVDQALSKLGPVLRVVVRMRMDGWTDAEIGAALGVCTVTVWEWQQRARNRLGFLMGQE